MSTSKKGGHPLSPSYSAWNGGPQKYVHLEFQNMTRFGVRVSVNVTKLRVLG